VELPPGQAGAVGVRDRLRPISDAGLGERVVDVRLHSRLADERAAALLAAVLVLQIVEERRYPG
jgi:hypothetical protein